MKTFVLSMVAVIALATSALAGDDLFSDVAGLKADSISDAQISIGNANDLALDVDGLANQATGEKSDKAIEACFRSFGYGCRGYNYGYNYGCYNYGYNYCRPSYSYCYQPSYYCYRPVCYSYSTCYTPCYRSYWGCY
jgi:hypothetical protein